jgi:hypothetical protein
VKGTVLLENENNIPPINPKKCKKIDWLIGRLYLYSFGGGAGGCVFELLLQDILTRSY